MPAPHSPRWPRLSAALLQLLLLVVGLVLALPVLALAMAWWQLDAESIDLLRHLADTVLPRYIATSLLLCLLVALGAGLIGMATACAVTLYDFPGRRFFEWALLLPLAAPAYVVAFAYTDFLQFSGPMQVFLRDTFGLQGRLFPEIRNVWGAAWVFIFTLYPYVYLLARTALSERATQLMEAARLLGAPMRRRIVEVALPLARPAIAAGIALALMETLADIGVTFYFGIQTFSTGIVSAWKVMDDRYAAAQLATMLLLTVALLLWVEQRAQRRMRFAAPRGGRGGQAEAQPVRLQGAGRWLVWVVCGLPILFGFVLPVLFMLRPLIGGWDVLPWSGFLEWAYNSLWLSGLAALLASAIALGLSFMQRAQPSRIGSAVTRVVSLGYAVPGVVIVIGILLPVGWLQTAAPASGVGFWVTATVLGIVWAYLVRFTAVALQSVQSGYARIPNSLDDSARMLGSTGPALLWRVHRPLLLRSIAAAALLVFVDVMKELPATFVLRPFGSDTLAVVAFQLARDERLGEAALPSLALVLVGLVPVILLSRTLRRT
jgi:iron(III) transport system permease protein